MHVLALLVSRLVSQNKTPCGFVTGQFVQADTLGWRLDKPDSAGCMAFPPAAAGWRRELLSPLTFFFALDPQTDELCVSDGTNVTRWSRGRYPHSAS